MENVTRTPIVRGDRLEPEATPWLLMLGNGIALLVGLLALIALRPGIQSMRAGQVAPDTVVAQHQVHYVDRVATVARRNQAAQSVTPAYRADMSIAQERLQQATSFFQRALPILAGNALPSVKLGQIRRLAPAGVSPSALQEIATLSPADAREVQTRTLSLLSQAIAWHFDSNQSRTTEISLLSTVPPSITLRERTAIGEALQTFLAPTLLPDSAATARKQQQAEARVPLVVDTIYPGEVVVRRGDLVTPSVVEKLTALGIQQHRSGWEDLAAALVFSVVILGMLFWYLRAAHPSVVGNPRILLFIDVSIVGSVASALVLGSSHVLLPYFLPLAAAPTFAAVLIAPDACVAIAIAMSLLTGWVAGNSFELTVYYLITSVAGVLGVYPVRQLKQFVFAGLYIAVFAFATMLGFGFVSHSYDFAAVQDYLLAAIFNGPISAALSLGAFALLAGYFGVTTSLNLLELAQPNQPLLRRLMVKAPGTYNHSYILGTMVERAAEEVGANSLVSKVGALYHDVGKSANPHCFAENQMGMGNIHDELEPEESARIIRAHVSQGLRLARQHKLPRVILDAIAEHHGTMTIPYFLHKARQQSADGWVDLSLYSYGGPKPQSKETALLMLADSCESAVRASPDHSGESIREIVNRMFSERIAQGQLDECPMTLRDVELAKEAFCAVLNGLYHPRIEYPEPPEGLVVQENLERETVARDGL